MPKKKMFMCCCCVTHIILKISHLTFFEWLQVTQGRVSKVEGSSIIEAQVHVECIPGWSGWMSKSRNGHNIPSETPERLGGWWLRAKRMLSANLCRQAVPPALRYLGNVLPNGPQNCLETTALLSLILDDPAKKQESIMKNKTLAEK